MSRLDLIAGMKNPKKATWVVVGVAVSVFVIWVIIFAIGLVNLRIDPARAGQFGDLFGCVNALFTGLALAGVAYAVVLQHQELDAAQAQLRAAEDEAKVALLTARLEAAQSIWSTLGQDDKTVGRIGKQLIEVKIKDKYSQYMRVLLTAIESAHHTMDHEPTRPKDMYLMYLWDRIRECREKCHAHLWDDQADELTISSKAPLESYMKTLEEEIRVLTVQEGVRWSKARTPVENALDMVQRITSHNLRTDARRPDRVSKDAPGYLVEALNELELTLK